MFALGWVCKRHSFHNFFPIAWDIIVIILIWFLEGHRVVREITEMPTHEEFIDATHVADIEHTA